jgi:hypothetical protein
MMRPSKAVSVKTVKMTVVASVPEPIVVEAATASVPEPIVVEAATASVPEPIVVEAVTAPVPEPVADAATAPLPEIEVITAPVELTRELLNSKTKAELVRIASEIGVDLDPAAKKADMINKIAESMGI